MTRGKAVPSAVADESGDAKMDYFQYVGGVLHCETMDARSLAADFGTPVYVYSARTLLEHLERLRTAFAPLRPRVHFSVKSCQNLSILRLLHEAGAGFDVVSGGELRRALEAGAAGAQIVFAGVGKTAAEIELALRHDIAWFNAESEEELEEIARRAEEAGMRAQVALRINPDVDPHTHEYTTTGKRSTKFGVDLERAEQVFHGFHGRPGLKLCGVHLHLGSPVNRVEPYVEAVGRALTLIQRMRGQGVEISALNLGGGFGAHYQGGEAPAAAAYAAQLVPLLHGKDLEVLLEPGRSLSANAGILLTKVLYTKEAGDRRFVIVDAAMTELIRPVLYGAYHFVWPVAPPPGMAPVSRQAEDAPVGCTAVDIVGPVCESGDFLARDRWIPSVRRGDLLCVFTTGAYGFVMGSQYNSRPRPPEVLVQDGAARLIRRGEEYEDLVRLERAP